MTTDQLQAEQDSVIEEYLNELDRYAVSRAASGKSFVNAFLDLGLANSRARSALDRYSIDERETDAGLVIEISEKEQLSLKQEDDTKSKPIVAAGGFSSGYAGTLMQAQTGFREAVTEALKAHAIEVRLQELEKRVSAVMKDQKQEEQKSTEP
ncbi:uncharacterized protein SAPINGB_P004537 [Magnusiomyces paraingens]|uniref:Uncharacterized protein n=1 Tax=Magnusiomyces paraingens TaxID=2606893 RepID=A0A5E8BXH4_9ASCO|nr:uncharacterized protein SAPINGB_P004537 [Saprochaete ingens]VVT55319.1 unnamed protein product [Saprochaete ingens]